MTSIKRVWRNWQPRVIQIHVSSEVRVQVPLPALNSKSTVHKGRAGSNPPAATTSDKSARHLLKHTTRQVAKCSFNFHSEQMRN